MMKRGQAAGAATLLAVIVGLIIFFIVVIPPQERAQLLGEQVSSGARAVNRTISSGRITDLLLTSPGRLDLLRQQEVEHALPSVKIYTRTESTEIERVDSLFVKRAAFSGTQANVTFRLDDLSRTENVLLTFNVKRGTGRLQVQLNGEEMFSREVDSGAIPKPIELSKSLLQEHNTLTFSVSSPGIAFWATNHYDIQDIAIVADLTSVKAQQAERVFLISETEKSNLERTELEFFPVCDTGEVGPLRITLNGERLYDGVPDCEGQKVIIEFAPNLVTIGGNELIFWLEQGEYQLSPVIIRSQLRAVDFPTYYFELSNEQFEDVTLNKKDVFLRLDFVDIVARKDGVLVINGRRSGFDTRDLTHEIDISSFVVRGNNAVTIIPERTLEIRELRVWLK